MSPEFDFADKGDIFGSLLIDTFGSLLIEDERGAKAGYTCRFDKELDLLGVDEDIRLLPS
jgi:hypothetical protein